MSNNKRIQVPHITVDNPDLQQFIDAIINNFEIDRGRFNSEEELVSQEGLTDAINDIEYDSAIPDASITADKIDTSSLNPIVQTVRTDDSAVSTGIIVMPGDDTIPQITEGDEYITVSITPKSITNKLIIEYGAYISSSSIVGSFISYALFQDSTSDALSAKTIVQAVVTSPLNVTGSYEMAAGTTSSTTFRLRVGSNNAGTTTFNGISGARRMGGVAGSYIKVTEVLQ